MNKTQSNIPNYSNLALLLGGTLCMLFPSLILMLEIKSLAMFIQNFGIIGTLIFGFTGGILLGSYVNATSKSKYASYISIAIALVALCLTFVLTFLTIASRFSL